MKNLSVRLISFKQTDDEPEYVYALAVEPRRPKIDDYIYMRNLGKFAAIQKVGHKEMLFLAYPLVEATNNPKYSLPPIPEAILKSYFDSNKQQTKFQLRID